jgi:tellurite resistance protein TerC
MTAKKALMRVIFWIGIALVFNLGVYIFMGHQKALEFLAGYVTEESLSIDNLFLFVLVFTSCGIGSRDQRRILNYGILGAIVLRLAFVLLGISIISSFHWVLYIFGGLLIFSGIRMMSPKEETFSLEENKILKVIKKIIPITNGLHGNRFFVRQEGRLTATPLFAILIVIEITDIIFAVDSIPAVFAITTDPFIVYSSNLLAILGLRSMYFLIGNLNEKFRLVKYGVAAVLVFTGLKLVLLLFHLEIPVAVSLVVIGSLVGASILFSLFLKNPPKQTELGSGCEEKPQGEEDAQA